MESGKGRVGRWICSVSSLVFNITLPLLSHPFSHLPSIISLLFLMSPLSPLRPPLSFLRSLFSSLPLSRLILSVSHLCYQRGPARWMQVCVCVCFNLCVCVLRISHAPLPLQHCLLPATCTKVGAGITQFSWRCADLPVYLATAQVVFHSDWPGA